MKAVFIARDGRAYPTKTAGRIAENVLFEAWADQSEFAEKVKAAASAEFEGDLDYPVHEMLKELFFDKIVKTVTADSLGIPVSEDCIDLSSCTS